MLFDFAERGHHFVKPQPRCGSTTACSCLPTSFDRTPCSGCLVRQDHLDSDLSASALARRFQMKEDALLSSFQSHTGLALDPFVLRRRIERALDLLKHTSATDVEIATSIGLGTAPTFRTAFFNYLGVSPTDYRKTLQPKKQAASLASLKRPCKSVSLPLKSGGEALRPLVL